MAQTFANENESISLDRGQVQHVVNYHEDHCGAFCTSTTPAAIMLMRSRLRTFFHSVSKRYKTPAAVRMADLLFACKIIGPADKTQRFEFIILAVNSFKHNRFQAREHFIRGFIMQSTDPAPSHEIVEVDSFIGADIVFGRHPFVSPHQLPRRPFRESDYGMLHQLDDDGVVALLLGEEFGGYATAVGVVAWQREEREMKIR